MDEEARGFKTCEEDYLLPLQSRLQEMILGWDDYQTDTDVLKDLKEMLAASDFRHQWTLDWKAIDKAIEADAFPEK